MDSEQAQNQSQSDMPDEHLLSKYKFVRKVHIIRTTAIFIIVINIAVSTIMFLTPFTSDMQSTYLAWSIVGSFFLISLLKAIFAGKYNCPYCKEKCRINFKYDGVCPKCNKTLL